MNDEPQNTTTPVTPPAEAGSTSYAVVGDYELRREIGRGGMGTVYEAWQKSLQRTVAVKVLSRQVSASSTAVTRFQREAQAAAKLHHAHIVPIFALGEDSGVFYYAMERIDGRGLNAIIAESRSLKSLAEPNEELADTVVLTRHSVLRETDHQQVHSGSDTIEAAETGADTVTMASSALSRRRRHDDSRFRSIAAHIANVADALDYAHRQGVIHRDIKPHNLLLGSNGKLMVSDFGLARLSEQPGVTVTGEVIGSPLYMSPEQISGDNTPVDQRTDIYALGATMYEWLTLTPPYPGDTRERVISKILTSEAPTLTWHDPTIPTDLETICLKAIEKDPSRRYQSAGELRDDLRRYLEHLPIRARRDGVLLRSVKFLTKRPIASLATAAVLVASTLGWALLDTGRDLKTQTAAIEQVQEDRERLLDDILSIMPAEIGGTIKLAEAAVPVLNDVVRSPSNDPRASGSQKRVSGADPSAAGTTTGIVRRMSHDLYTNLAPVDWPNQSIDPSDATAQLAQLALEKWDGDPMASVERLSNYLQKNPQSFEAWQLQTALLGYTGQSRLMIQAIESMERLKPGDLQNNTWRAIAYLLNDDAVRSLQLLTRNQPNEEMIPWLLTLRSLALARVGAALEAFLALNEALDRDPDLVVALLARASIQAAAGNATGSIADLSRVIELEPENANVIGLRGDRFVETGDYSAAAEDYDRAMAIAGRSPNMVVRYLYARTQGRAANRGSEPSAGAPAVSTEGVSPTSDSTGGFFENLVRRFL